MGVSRSPQQGAGAEPVVRGQTCKPFEAESFLAFCVSWNREIGLIAYFLAFYEFVNTKALRVQNVYRNIPAGMTHVYENTVPTQKYLREWQWSCTASFPTYSRVPTRLCPVPHYH